MMRRSPSGPFVADVLEQVAAVASLASLPAPGQAGPLLVWVESFACAWVLDRASTLAPDGVTCVAAAGIGRWLRLAETSSPKWLRQAAWFIDPAAGSDEAAGTAVAPLQSMAELQRRLSTGEVQQSTTVTYVSGFTGDQLLDVRMARGASLVIEAARTTFATDTVATFTARTHAGTPEGALLTATGIADWTPYVGMLVERDTFDVFSWVAKVNPNSLGNNVARMSTFTAATTGGASSPIVGNSITVEELTANAGEMILSVTGEAAPLVTLKFIECDGAYVKASGNLRLQMCSINGALRGHVENVEDWGSKYGATTQFIDVIPSGQFRKQGGLFTSASVSAFQPTRRTLERVTFQGTTLSPRNGTIYDLSDVQFFDRAAQTAIDCVGPCSVHCSGQVSGTGYGTGLGVTGANGGPVVFQWSNDLPNLQGTTAQIRLSPAGAYTVTETWATVRYWSNAQNGVGTLVAGTATIPARNANTAGVQITRDTPGGTLGHLSCPIATCTATQFVVNSSDAGDTSTFRWSIPATTAPIWIGKYNAMASLH